MAHKAEQAVVPACVVVGMAAKEARGVGKQPLHCLTEAIHGLLSAMHSLSALYVEICTH